MSAPRRWTAEVLADLRARCEAGTPRDQIAYDMGLTVGALRWAANEYRLKLPPLTRDPAKRASAVAPVASGKRRYVARGEAQLEPWLAPDKETRQDHEGHVKTVLSVNPMGFTGPWGLKPGGADYWPGVV